jgi:hypothetical protein
MTVRITKAQAIEAIRTEPKLRPGSWASPTSSTNSPKVGDETNCRVCAVGAVLRDLLNPALFYGAIQDAAAANTEDHIYTALGFTREAVEAETRALLQKGAVWNALSVLFEGYFGLIPRPGALGTTEQIQEAVCGFVDAEFPEDWALDICPELLRPGVTKEVTS